MSVAETFLVLLAASLPLAAAVWVLFAPRNRKRDPTVPGWRVVIRQLGREQRTNAMSRERALSLAARLIYGAVKVVRLDNDAAGTTMGLAEIRAYMERETRGEPDPLP